MLKRMLILLAVMTSLSAVAIAQSARNPVVNRTGKSNLTNISVSGLDVNGNPGYIELTGTTGNNQNETVLWYLYVDSAGKLRMASQSQIEAFSSFPTGDWRQDQMKPGVVVGSQS